MEAILLAPIMLGLIILYITTPFFKSRVTGKLWLIIGGLSTLLLLSLEGVKLVVFPFPALMIGIGILLLLKKNRVAYLCWLIIFLWFSSLYTLLLGIPGALLLIVGLTWSIYIRKRFEAI
ncbi:MULTISPECIES: hypothetical protein [Brevibacillus]|jgi:hypothetical protein|uniref:Uncharacterized protein n=1 Tax=Brevibacillus parabrevis TaxID=54914 RepID=A0A4Y3PR44_BREPA|nr:MULTISPECIES: hypothetical protein [Brevibacillus]MBU8710888.1 hypothetical protein [Brevibacillus parabrevis]MED2253557.1 hypothetical protein [Brevibacillus parabrevis]RNB90232.1 hypothetical protein EDM60_28095 [Brevibacillus parabrevis]WDV98027.1 hypothetical protein PSE45_14035 [Brevibacillus parabrevis]GEB35863.1 hypothetical protein BPA01_54430 [Brevibacillus parabrevis]